MGVSAAARPPHPNPLPGGERELSRGEGGLDGAGGGPVALVIDQVVKPRAFKETDRVKLAEIDSKLLTDFHKRPVKLRAGGSAYRDREHAGDRHACDHQREPVADAGGEGIASGQAHERRIRRAHPVQRR